MDERLFETVKRFYKSKPKQKLLELTQLSKSALSKCIAKIECAEDDDAKFQDLYKKPGNQM